MASSKAVLFGIEDRGFAWSNIGFQTHKNIEFHQVVDARPRLSAIAIHDAVMRGVEGSLPRLNRSLQERPRLFGRDYKDSSRAYNLYCLHTSSKRGPKPLLADSAYVQLFQRIQRDRQIDGEKFLF